MEGLFWLSVFGIVYPYLGYPAVLWVLGRFSRRQGKTEGGDASFYPPVSMIIPVCNEERRIERKIVNTEALRYPADRLQVLFVSDGSTDRTVELIRTRAHGGMTLVECPVRRGKAAALNAGLEQAKHDILVFSDAAIELEPDALRNIVRRFRDPAIGCVSGEDKIAESGGEAWYGRYELLVRRLESKVHSIVGASGSFYAQRRNLCVPFVEGMAPDFLSVLRTVEQGYRAVSEPDAVGTMTSVKDSRQEFERKVRTLIRGMTALFSYARVLNPARFGVFALEMLSHKVLRWAVPFFLITALLSSVLLMDSPWFLFFSTVQIAFYLVALLAFSGWHFLRHSLPGKVALYFSMVNAAILVAWLKYATGVRQELWTPSQR
ncbi:glycosyltransferase family 2 protein [Nitrospira sp. NS4]|uniref:glycosyltransferase family 2 protein n=1 Tax=Nitrospira sp. NS4 TaxID=3414498 RepID=UPI003C2E0625